MIEHVLQRPRGKGKKSKYWTGRYSLGRGERYVEVALGLTDAAAARAKLHEIVIEAQRERVGLLPKKSLREAAAAPIGGLLDEYKADLLAQKRQEKHVKDTVRRARDIITACKWARLSDIRADAFIKWRRTFHGAPKTLKEYQASLNAFLNRLVMSERLERNPVARVPKPETRGKEVRPSRAFTLDELAALFAAARSDEHRIALQMLAYTGQRAKEIAALAWGGRSPFRRAAVRAHPRDDNHG
jgi:hypothetical protein